MEPTFLSFLAFMARIYLGAAVLLAALWAVGMLVACGIHYLYEKYWAIPRYYGRGPFQRRRCACKYQR